MAKPVSIAMFASNNRKLTISVDKQILYYFNDIVLLLNH